MFIKSLLRLLVGLLFVNLVVTLIVDHSDEEYVTIDKSRKIIKRIENCKQDERNAFNLYSIDDYQTPILNENDVKCGQTTFMDVTKLIADKIKDEQLTRLAMGSGYQALNRMNTFSEMASFIEKEIEQFRPGTWLVMVGRIMDHDTSQKTRIAECLDFSISHIRIKVFKIRLNSNHQPTASPMLTNHPSTTPKITNSTVDNMGSNVIGNLIASVVSNTPDIRKNLIFSSAAMDLLPFVKYLINEKKIDPESRDEHGRTPASYAALNNSLTVLKYLIEDEGINSYVRDMDGNTLVHLAASTGALDVLKYLIRTEELDPNARNNFGETPLHKVASGGTFVALRYLIEEAQADLDVKSQNSTTPLQIAAIHNRADMMKYLVSKGAAPLPQPETNDQQALNAYLKFESKPFALRSLLMSALNETDLTALKYIIEVKNTSLDSRFDDGRSFLHYAVQYHQIAFVKYLIKRGIRLDLKDKNGNTPLIDSAYFGCLDCVKYLIQNGANPNEKNAYQATPIHFAIMSRNLKVMKYLIEEQNVDVNAGNIYDYRPIHLASYYDCLNCMKYLIKKANVDVNSKSKYGYTALGEAAKFKRLDIVKYLVEHGADLNVKDNYDMTPLKSAEKIENNQEVINYLRLATVRFEEKFRSFDLVSFFSKALTDGNLNSLEYIVEGRKINVNHEFVNGKTLLTYAIEYGQLPFVQYLVRKGVNLNKKDSTGVGYVNHAAQVSLDIFRYLISNGGDVNETDQNGASSIHYCLVKGKLDVLRYLVEERRINPNLGNNYGYKPIHVAASYKYLDTVKYLVENAKVDVNVRSLYKFTALGEAAKHKQLNNVKYLIENGADFTAIDYHGKTVLQVAEDVENNHEVVEYLKAKLNGRPKRFWFTLI